MQNLKNIFSVERRTEYFIRVLAFLFIASIAVFVLIVAGGDSPRTEKDVVTREEINPFKNITLEGKSVMVFDVVNNRELFSKNPDLSLPLASLTKILTAVVANEKLDGNQNIKIKREYLEPEGDSELIVGDTWRMCDLRDFTLLTSSNDGAFALAAAITESPPNQSAENARTRFLRSMNEAASFIGLSNSKFFNEHGLDRFARIDESVQSDMKASSGGSYGTARDMVALFEYVLKNNPEILEATRYKNLRFDTAEKVYLAENTNAFINKIPNVIASKTGFTDLAGGNLVVAFDAGLNRPIIISVLGSTEEGRFSDVLKLVEASMRQINEEN